MRNVSLIRVIGLRLLLALAACIGSFVLGYLYMEAPLSGSGQLVVVLLFYVLLCAWPCLLVSAAGRTLKYLQQHD